MKKAAAFLSLIILTVPVIAHAQRISMLPPDKGTRVLVEKIFLDFGIGTQTPVRARAAWLDIEDGKQPYLFVKSASNCPKETDCEIFGFHRDKNGEWKKVYAQFGAKGLSVLDTVTDGHHDLEHWEKTPNGYRVKVSRWKGDAYGDPEIQDKSYFNFTKMAVMSCAITRPTGKEPYGPAPQLQSSDVPPWLDENKSETPESKEN